jgi:hypothetical protein
MPTSEMILADLRKTFGRRAVLYPEDMAELLGARHHVVKSLAKGMSLPLTLKKVKGRWGVSIYSVAEWLAESDSNSNSTTSSASTSRLKTPARTRASLGKAILALQTQRDFLEELLGDLRILSYEIDRQYDEVSSTAQIRVRSGISAESAKPRRSKGPTR